LVCEAIGTAATPGLLCQPRVIVKMIVEKQMECRLAGETEVLGENLPQRHFCPSRNPTWPDSGLYTWLFFHNVAYTRHNVSWCIERMDFIGCSLLFSSSRPFRTYPYSFLEHVHIMNKMNWNKHITRTNINSLLIFIIAINKLHCYIPFTYQTIFPSPTRQILIYYLRKPCPLNIFRLFGIISQKIVIFTKMSTSIVDTRAILFNGQSGQLIRTLTPWASVPCA
jgi:hypothetical protein